MASMAIYRPPTGIGQLVDSIVQFANVLKPVRLNVKPIPMKLVTYLHGEPIVQWEQKEVDQMIINENLEYAVRRKFTYGWVRNSRFKEINF